MTTNLAASSAARSKRRGRLLLLITLAEVGGAQSYVMDLLPALSAEFDVTVAAYGEGPLAAAARAAGAAYVPLRHVRRPVSLVRDARGLFELWRLCRDLSPEIVHANSSKAGVLGRLAALTAGVPIRIFTAHGWAFKATSGPSATAYLWADRLARLATTAVICVSKEEREAGLRARTSLPDRTFVIHNGIDASSIPQRRHESRRPVRVVSVGRLAAPKDFATLLRALAQPEAAGIELTILGDGPLRGALAAETARLGLDERVQLAGEVTDVRERLASFDGFVLSSASEGFPISLLEAAAAGLPIVASAVGGVPEIVVDGETGYLVEPGDVTGFAARMRALADDARLRTTLGSAARKVVEERFSLAACRAGHLELYRMLYARNGA